MIRGHKVASSFPDTSNTTDQHVHLHARVLRESKKSSCPPRRSKHLSRSPSHCLDQLHLPPTAPCHAESAPWTGTAYNQLERLGTAFASVSFIERVSANFKAATYLKYSMHNCLDSLRPDPVAMPGKYSHPSRPHQAWPFLASSPGYT